MIPSDFFDKFTTYATVDLDAIARNVQQLKAHIGQRVELFGVVKANAYGHGIVQVSRTVLENGATRLAVGRVGEGIALREAGIDSPILIMGYTVPGEAPAIVDHGLMATVNTFEGAQALAQHARENGKKARVHLKVDTGMGRYGLLPDEVTGFLEQLSSLPEIEIEGIYTHFSTADSADKSYAQQQFNIFMETLSGIEQAGFYIPLRHAANSAATLDLPEMHLDAVRPGIAMYGLSPSSETEPAIPLEPALSLKTHVARVRTLPENSSISYGRTYITTKPTKVALVMVGYGDGYQRLLSNTGHVLIGGRPAPILGRVCMDQFVVDVSAIDGVRQDDEVVLLGRQQGEVITADMIAKLTQTINYEVTTSILPRVPRIYLRNGEVAEVADGRYV